MSEISVIGQNFSIFEGDGKDPFARTGEIGPRHLADAGAEGVIIGHSEIDEDAETVNKKLNNVVDSDSSLGKIVVLVGEDWEDFEDSTIDEVASIVVDKCSTAFQDVPEEALTDLIVGYEPKWGTRGSGKDEVEPPQPELISRCIEKLRDFFKNKYDSTDPYFIYGGRTTPERTRKILSDDNIDGLILGSACNTVQKTLEIAENMEEICGSRDKVIVCNFKAYELGNSYKEYVQALSKLSDEFIFWLSPPHTHLGELRELIDRHS